jgi:hypothetical protein
METRVAARIDTLRTRATLTRIVRQRASKRATVLLSESEDSRWRDRRRSLYDGLPPPAHNRPRNANDLTHPYTHRA